MAFAGWGFLLLLFPWTRNFSYSHCFSHPAVKPGTYCILCNQGTAEKQLHIADVVIPVKKSQKKITWWDKEFHILIADWKKRVFIRICTCHWY